MTKLRKRNKLVCGVGINDADYNVYIHDYTYKHGKKHQVVTWTCPFYRKWCSMLRRCYSQKYISDYPTYKDCSVCEEWLTFSNFKAWMENKIG